MQPRWRLELPGKVQKCPIAGPDPGPPLELDGTPASDEALMAWLDGAKGELVLNYRGQRVPVAPIRHDDVPAQLGFTRLPKPPAP